MDEQTGADLAAYTGCIAGALTEEQFSDGLRAAGFVDLEIRETHRVHEHAIAAIIRARKPDGAVVGLRLRRRAGHGPSRSRPTPPQRAAG
ncbi:MAG: hypothetical protein ACLP01_27100 [Solirubrobacteraceae bacterium]